MSDIQGVNKLKTKAPGMVPVSEMSNIEIVEEVKKWWKPNISKSGSSDIVIPDPNITR